MKAITTLSLIIGLLCSMNVTAQRFEGSIGFTKNIGPVTAKYVYMVKDHMIRVEELDELGDIQGIMLVNTENNTVVALSPERKMYIDVPNRRKSNESETNVKATGKTQMINGYECEEWSVSSDSDGRKVSYWVAKDDFDFFVPMLKTLNRKDKMALYYMNLPNATGTFPMKGTEVKSDGMELTRLQVDKVEKGALSAELFKIPEGYTKFERETSD
ncbi:MAG: DUF4412 domain-containing protein [Flavobacteriales bacterium]|nr:DUF4412 domain-containing protein [Flavobacteriales bacterium]